MFSNTEYHELEEERDALKARVAELEAGLAELLRTSLESVKKLESQLNEAVNLGNRAVTSAEQWQRLADERKVRADNAQAALELTASMAKLRGEGGQG